MNFPAVAKQTYEKLKDNSQFFSITKRLIERIRNIKTAFIRARIVHREVDKHITELFTDPAVRSNVKCGKGCSACCHTHVSVSKDEAALLAKRVVDDTPIDTYRLYLQAQAYNDSSLWYRLNYQERSCLFLNEKGECRVYEDRPSVCRTNYVLSEPHQCLTIDGREQFVRLLKTDQADMAIMASFVQSEENGALPFMLYKALQKENETIAVSGPLSLPPYKNLTSV